MSFILLVSAFGFKAVTLLGLPSLIYSAYLTPYFQCESLFHLFAGPCTSASHLQRTHVALLSYGLAHLLQQQPLAALLSSPWISEASPSILSVLFTAGFSQRARGFAHSLLPPYGAKQ